MTENLPAVPDAPTREVAVVDTDSWVDVMRPLIALADRIYDTEFVPKGLRGSAPATAAAMLYGREVGLPPLTALNMTHVVEGKPGLSAEGMRAVVLAAGHDLEFVESTGAICTMRARRRGGDNWTTISWTIDAARQAGLAHKNVWKSYPRVMLQARCTTELCRMVFPDVIHGFRSAEELEDMSDEDAPQAAAPAASSTSKVTRARAVKKSAAAPAALPAAPPARPEPTQGPPLPGEDGYDEATTQEPQGGAGETTASSDGETSAGGTDEAATPTQGEGAGTTEEPPADVANPPTEAAAEEKPPGRKASRAQHRLIFASLAERGIEQGDDEERHAVVTALVGREVESFNDLTSIEAKQVIDTLARTRDKAGLYALLDEVDAQRAIERADAEAGQP